MSSEAASVIITRDQLRAARGENPGDKLWVGLYVPARKEICIFDVSSRSDLYGPNESYHIFTGRDASYALGTMKLDAPEGSHEDLKTEAEINTLGEWAEKYLSKYPVVGVLEGSPA